MRTRKAGAQRSRAAQEATGGSLSLIGAYAMLLGISPALVSGALGMLLIGGAGVLGLLAVLVMVRAGKGFLAALLQVLLLGIVMFAVISGVMWYFTVHRAHDPNLLRFDGPTASPK
jgi:hypothetical protein